MAAWRWASQRRRRAGHNVKQLSSQGALDGPWFNIEVRLLLRARPVWQLSARASRVHPYPAVRRRRCGPGYVLSPASPRPRQPRFPGRRLARRSVATHTVRACVRPGNGIGKPRLFAAPPRRRLTEVRRLEGPEDLDSLRAVEDSWEYLHRTPFSPEQLIP